MSKIDISKVQAGDWLKIITHIFNSGYMSGHNDTVDGNFYDVIPQDYDTEQADIVEELLGELITDHRKEPPEEAEDEDQHEWLLEQIQRCQVGECSCRWLRNEIEKRWMRKSELQRDVILPKQESKLGITPEGATDE